MPLYTTALPAPHFGSQLLGSRPHTTQLCRLEMSDYWNQHGIICSWCAVGLLIKEHIQAKLFWVVMSSSTFLDHIVAPDFNLLNSSGSVYNHQRRDLSVVELAEMGFHKFSQFLDFILFFRPSSF